MTKTLADMTPEQRAECVGMWCDVTNASVNEDKPVLLCSDKEANGILPIYIPWVTASLYPSEEGVSGWPASALAPRFDLPRVWNPDGVPVAGDWEYAVQYKTRDGWKYSRPSWENRWQDSEAVQEVRAYRDHRNKETRVVRRLVTQPEVMEP